MNTKNYFGLGHMSLSLAILAASQTAAAASKTIEEVIVTDQKIKHTINIDELLTVLPDTAQLIKKVPGASVNGNGPLTGIPQYRGMYGSRIGVTVNGNQIAPSGPNWMDPPLSYAAPSQLKSLEVYRGISSVSVAQESIGGVIAAHTWQGDFTDQDAFTLTGHATLSAQSVNDGNLFSTTAVIANQAHKFTLAAMTEQADDAEFSAGRITPSEYKRSRGNINYGFKSANHQFNFGLTHNKTGNAGTPSLPMDIDYFEGDFIDLNHTYQNESWTINTSVYTSKLDHGMTNYHLRNAPMEKSMWRQNAASVDNLGFKLTMNHQDNLGNWKFGVDYFDEEHQSNIDNPNNPMFFVVNFNNAQRKITGIFTERQHKLNDQLHADFGLRINKVKMNADQVDATPARMMPPAMVLRDNFNNADRSHSDTNVDAMTKLWFNHSDSTTYYLGLAHKTRAPSYQERFLWLPLQATAGLADGLTYTGNLNLKSESANEIELGLDYKGRNFEISPRAFYREVDDYIQGTPSNVMPAVMMVNMMNMANGSNNPTPLQFNNVDAAFYGFDTDWRYRLNEHWQFSGLLNYVRGKRDDIKDNLYRIAPTNASIAADYLADNWGAKTELIIYDKQNKVSLTNQEATTNGYELVNFSAWWKFGQSSQLAIGINNLFDEEYLDHLAGYNRAFNPDIKKAARLPGYGRNAFLRFDHSW